MKTLLCIALCLGLVVGPQTRAAETVPHQLTLSQCLELAFTHSPAVRTASEQFLSAEGQSLKLHAILYPTVNAQAVSTPLTFYVQVQEIIYSRATLPQLRLSRLTREQAFLNYRQALVDTTFQVRQAFTSALGARQQAALSQSLIGSRQAALKTAQGLFNAGRLQRSDVLPLQVLVSLGQQNDTLALLTQQQGAITLSQAIGVDLPSDTQLVGKLADDGPPNFDVGQLTAQALRDRQDLQLLENAKLQANQQIEIDLRNAYPTFGFQSNSALQPPAFLPGGGGYDLERNFDEPETQRQTGDTQLPLSLYLDWIIFDGGNLAGVKLSDRARIASQQVAVDALRHSIPSEIAAAVAAIDVERATLALLQQQPSASQDEHDADTDYQAGRVRLLDKVNLESDIVRQRQLRLASQIRLSLALAALNHALGRGLEVNRSAPSP